ncbi:hypothetical protein Tco_1348103, partial [Tanacetum coccineum]
VDVLISLLLLDAFPSYLSRKQGRTPLARPEILGRDQLWCEIKYGVLLFWYETRHSRPELSFDITTSLECMPGLARASSTEVANAITIKERNGTWQMQMDYTSLNKVYAKDMYPFLKIEKELESLMGYQYKCFLCLPKEHSQVRMLENDEEKTAFHTDKEYTVSPTCQRD